MEAGFWHERWQSGRIGFHQAETNRLLAKHWPKLAHKARASAEVFVPLCGKSLDMVWLAGETGETGNANAHRIIGVELSPIAVKEFFDLPEVAQAGQVETHRQGDHEISRAGKFEIWAGDYFTFPKSRLANVKLAYDRASLIALPIEMRQRYAKKLCELLPDDAKTLLITITYDQSEMDGPPFSVTDDEVFALFEADRNVERLETSAALEPDDRLRERGLTGFGTSVFVIGTAK